jgi:cytochrome c biogenesis protein
VKPAKFLTARSTVIALITAISAALLVASVVPQRSSTGGKTPEWVGRLPDGLHFLSTLLGLDNVIGTGWFAALVGLFWLSLVVSAGSQYRAARSLANRVPPAVALEESICVRMTPDSFAVLALGAGYRAAGSVAGVRRYVKNRIGYWGNFLLHIGLVTAVFFSLVYVLTQHRLLVRLTGQEITKLSSANTQEMRGLIPLQQRLPYSMVLKALEPRFWANDNLERLSSELYITDQAGGDPRHVDVALSDKSQFGPYLVYQMNAYGRAFDLEFVSAGGEMHRERLFLPYPLRRDAAGYGEMAIPGTDLLLKGKFYADAGRKTMRLNSPPLTLRLYRGKELQGEVTLAPGAREQLGPFAVRLGQSEWWTDILLDGTRGIAGIFAGFALILVGVLSSYCLVPRELIVGESDGGICVQHVVRRFAQFYSEEFNEIIQGARDRGET